MSRFARVVVPGLPHHVTQRGNRKSPIFFEPGDEQLYMRILKEQLAKAEVEAWAYCLMPNLAHLILTPRDEAGLARALGEAQRRYTSLLNARHGWVGRLFQGRFASVVMDERHLINAVRYVALNPVRAGLVRRAEDWPWSSARAHLAGRDDGLVKVRPLLDRVPAVAELFEPAGACDPAFASLRRAESTGRPLGSDAFVAGLEAQLGRPLASRKPGARGQVILSPARSELSSGAGTR